MSARNLSCILATLSILLTTKTLFAQDTAFRYQGRLNVGAGAANASYDLTFALFSTSSGAGQVGSTLARTATPVSNGLFIVTLDFGSEFPGSDRWLEISVRTNNGGAFATLTPRQKITATPYAITAGNLTGTLPSGALAGTYGSTVTFNSSSNTFVGSFTGNGTGLTNVSAATLGGLGASSFWKTAGNAGTTPGAHFIGTTDNQPFEIKANNARAVRFEPIPNDVNNSNIVNVVAGSEANSVSAMVVGATIAGGGARLFTGLFLPNRVGGDFGTIGGGDGNTVAGVETTIAGGGWNNALADQSTIGGGVRNTIAIGEEGESTIAGGGFNSIGSNSGGSAIGGGANNKIAGNSFFATIAGGGLNNVGTNSEWCTIGGGSENNIADNSFGVTIAGGAVNKVGNNLQFSTIAGGGFNQIGADSWSSVIGGGQYNKIAGDSYYVTIAGGQHNDVGTTSWYSTINGGLLNKIAGNSFFATIAGGSSNDIGTNSHNSVIGGGDHNRIGDNSSFSAIAGGTNNHISANSPNSTINGGADNTIATNSPYAIIPGGQSNTATNYAFAAGRRAKANHSGSWVWGDSNDSDIVSTNADSVTMRASGGYRLLSDSGATAGVFLAPGGTSWAVISDRNAKKGFAPVDSRTILEKLVAMPITQWHYRWEEEQVTPHIGPMAQDFKAAFYPGSDDRSITTQEADGVALAAIQGLNQKVEQKNAEITELKRKNAEMESRLGALEKLLNRLTVAQGGE